MQRIELDHRLVDACAFVLLDPCQGDAHALDAWADLPQQSLVPSGFAVQAERLPRLIDTRGIDNAARLCLVDLLLGSPSQAGALCVALLQTQADAERIALCFRKVLAPHFPDDYRGLFWFYDPVVFEHLTWMLDSHALAALFGPITAWHLPLRGAWYTQTPPAGDAPLVGFPFHLNPTDWQRVFRIGAIHAALDHEPHWRDAPTEWGPKAEALLICAEGHQLTDRDDAVAFAAHGLRWHSDFDRHPRVAAVLKGCEGHPSRYRRLTGSWGDAEWQAIVNDLEGRARTERPLPLTAASF